MAFSPMAPAVCLMGPQRQNCPGLTVMSTAKWHSLPILLVERRNSEKHPPPCLLLGHREQITGKALLLFPQLEVASRAWTLTLLSPVGITEPPTSPPCFSGTRDSLDGQPRNRTCKRYSSILTGL